jgi:hypothetical protein
MLGETVPNNIQGTLISNGISIPAKSGGGTLQPQSELQCQTGVFLESQGGPPGWLRQCQQALDSYKTEHDKKINKRFKIFVNGTNM